MLRRLYGGTSTLPLFVTPMSSFLFPTPSLPQSSLTPSHFPGVSPDSTTTLQNVLKDNHAKWHIFFNEKRFHNHAAHRAIAAWSLGANSQAIQSAYEKDCSYEKPAFKSPEEITFENFNEYLGDDRYMNSFIFQLLHTFFTSYVKEKGGNLGSGSVKGDLPKEKQPQMLSRFFSGVLHPLIHTGYGAEFTLPGMVVEGLAQTAVHYSSPVAELLEHLKLFEESNSLMDPNLVANAGRAIRSAFDKTVNAFDLALDKALPESHYSASNSTGAPSKYDNADDSQQGFNLTKSSADVAGPHALTILYRVLNDSQFFTSKALADDENNMFEYTIRKHGDALASYVDQWHVTGETVDKKIEEVVWAVCVLYGVAGWTHRRLTEGKKFNADFFFMHLVTSSIFLPALCAELPPDSQVRLLKAYFAVALAWAIARGRPSLDVKGFVEALQDPKSLSAPSSKPAWESTWLRMVEEARTHHDEHLTKIIRALAGWASAFGTRKSRAKLPSSNAGDLQNKLLTEDEAYSAGLGMGLGRPKEGSFSSAGSITDKSTTKTGAADFMQSDVPPPANYPDLKKGTTGADSDSNVLPPTELPGSEYLDGRLFAMVAEGGQRDEEEFWDFVGFFARDVSPRL
ncbi:hypothetical protein CPB84DRAFT_1781641 [Gymnopilus junonius]|uniref:Uncharacterized protein n=1 Tax=Gymnopilus junonius TaxID=109634 RepID=A0A9P5NKY9_GYMJU|nr:hypothetical protein CPB84DRAFT_1781641 [Gymnopilus junonius]